VNYRAWAGRDLRAPRRGDPGLYYRAAHCTQSVAQWYGSITYAASVWMPLPGDDAVSELNCPDRRRRPHRHRDQGENRKPDRRFVQGGHRGSAPKDGSGLIPTCHGPRVRHTSGHAFCARDRHYVAIHPLAAHRQRDGPRQNHLSNRGRIPPAARGPIQKVSTVRAAISRSISGATVAAMSAGAGSGSGCGVTARTRRRRSGGSSCRGFSGRSGTGGRRGSRSWRSDRSSSGS